MTTKPSVYDWQAALGDLPEHERRPGQAGTVHKMTLALGTKDHPSRLPAAYRERARKVLRHVLTLAEGRLDEVAAILGCSWHVAQRLVKVAELAEEAGDLRFRHGHRGPTGYGVQPRASSSRAKTQAKSRKRVKAA